MMVGVVNSKCEATIRLVIGNATNKKQVVDGIIDTGFTGSLSLPAHIIRSLSLPWICSDIGILGDGSEVIFDMYQANIIWDGQLRNIDIAESETEPLVGMSLLYGCDLKIEIVEGGLVTITAMPSFQ